jgi:hypothetical protein
MTIVQIPYALIGNIVAAGFIIAGFVLAETRGRIVIAALAAATFIVPKLAESLTVGTVCYVARIVLALGCAIYTKWRNAAI